MRRPGPGGDGERARYPARRRFLGGMVAAAAGVVLASGARVARAEDAAPAPTPAASDADPRPARPTRWIGHF